MVWTIGGTFDINGRNTFDLVLREIIKGPLLEKTK